MKDGSYRYGIEMTVPLGRRYGQLELRIDGGSVQGVLTMFNRAVPIEGGQCAGSAIQFNGAMRTLSALFHYIARGRVSAHFIELDFDTERGSYHALGTSKAARGRAKNFEDDCL